MSEIKVGLLAIAAMASAVFMSLKITSNQSGFGEYTTYRTIIKDASGIFPKTPIKVAGINAGKIKKIELQANSALITFEVLNRVKITNGSKLRIKSVGFLGDKYLEISIGASETRLTEDTLIPSVEGAGIETLVRDAGEVLGDVKVLVRELKNTMAPETGESPIKTMLTNLAAASKDAKEMMESLNQTITGNKKKINDMIANFEKMAANLEYQTNKENPDSAMKDVGKILADAKKMTKDLSDLVSDIKAGKGTMGKILVEEEIADSVKTTLAGVNRLVSRVDNIRTELSLFTGAETDGNAYTDANFRIFPAPERFYMLGVATSALGPESRTITTTSVDGATESTEVRSTRNEDTIRFNIMLGRKIQNFTFRVGVFESTGGAGIDYEKYSWGSRFSLDAFDYREEIGPNVRFTYQFRLWNVFYAKVMGNDLLDDGRSAIVSAGLQFNDEDLKGLVAFFFGNQFNN
jgi:phospholipid/cholesterol/gamma-HCH transport system substrate-binding protein